MLTTSLGHFRKCEIVLCGKVVCLLPVTDHKEPRLCMYWQIRNQLCEKMDFSSPEEILHDGDIGKHLSRALEKLILIVSYLKYKSCGLL